MTAVPGFDLEETAQILSDVTEKVVRDLSGEGLKDSPQIKTRPLIEYEGKLRLLGMDLFNESTYITAASFYLSEKDRDNHSACGAVAFYLKKGAAADLYKYIGTRGFDDESDEEMMTAAEGFYAKVVDAFQSELARKGYAPLVRSPFESYLNNAPFGIDFCPKEFDVCEITRSFKGKTALVMDLTLTPLPKA